jgi:hypothetical protein
MKDGIVHLSRKYEDYDFFITSDENVVLPNVFYVKDVHKQSGKDLNINAYLATYCDIIVGRSSGPFTFCLNTACLTNATKYITFSDINLDSGYYGLQPWYGDKFLCTNSQNTPGFVNALSSIL